MVPTLFCGECESNSRTTAVRTWLAIGCLAEEMHLHLSGETFGSWGDTILVLKDSPSSRMRAVHD